MLTAGFMLQGRYRIERSIGQGGMGEVYLATHLALGAPVAIKEMTAPAGGGPAAEAAIAQFRTEGQMLRQLHHPGLPALLDFFEQDGNYYLAMDYIAGSTLDDICERQGIPTEGMVVGWACQICDVLNHLHTHQPAVIFRDLKPANVMVADSGRLKLIDFGISKIFDPANGTSTTQTAVRGAGTPGFAAPEQYAGGTDAQSDLYALGATLYTLLSGRVPPASVALSSGTATLVPLRELNPRVSERMTSLVERLMSLKRSGRPASVSQVRDELDGLMYDIPLPVDEPRVVSEQPRRPSMRRAASLALAGVLLVAGGVLGRVPSNPPLAQAALLAPEVRETRTLPAVNLLHKAAEGGFAVPQATEVTVDARPLTVGIVGGLGVGHVAALAVPPPVPVPVETPEPRRTVIVPRPDDTPSISVTKPTRTAVTPAAPVVTDSPAFRRAQRQLRNALAQKSEPGGLGRSAFTNPRTTVPIPRPVKFPRRRVIVLR